MTKLEPLNDREKQVLDLERRSFRYSGAKDRAIQDDLGMTPTGYYQLLTRLVDDERAIAADPMLINRIRQRRRTADRADRHPQSTTR
ncbi:DUF3263 domain-containing protein [Auritidibacter ignavus]|uniref:DUF3263 domain-containing protein n=1 Tax=Auritidibacter ignavus TaxID=678932 RepID=UPI00244A6A8E|nr:DUF3263 domain-containing protein [Auritidibacter ignavus]WGH80548.1 DUF3263 domain-containing protein [Auritidibacter ignavus]